MVALPASGYYENPTRNEGEGKQYIEDIRDFIAELYKHNYGLTQRSIFTYNGGATAYTVKAKSASYWCKDKFCWWDAELTTPGVDDDISSPAADTWYYLYLDYSSIADDTEITASEFSWSDTAPSWNTTYKGWYNGDDRCIFAALTNGTPNNIINFIHEGDYVYQVPQQDANGIDPGSTPTDVTLSIPVFSEKANITFIITYSNINAWLYWRPDGKSDLVATVGRIESGNAYSVHSALVTTVSQIIEVYFSEATSNNTLDIYANGWYFPIGM